MTPNGTVAFAVVMVGAAMLAGGRGLAILALAAAVFAAIEVGARSWAALRRAALLMLPLAAFMVAVWVGVVGRAPAEISAGLPGTRSAALFHVATICARLFVIVFVLQTAGLVFDGMTPLQFIRALRVPIAVKRLLALTLSLIETLRHAVDRSHTALVAAGIITRRLSLRNVVNGWVLAQTVWLTAITSVTGRLRDKWPIENTLSLLDPALTGGDTRLSRADVAWLAAAIGAAIIAVGAGYNGTP